MNKGFPRTAKYDPEWMKANMMGPNAIMLLERLSEHMGFSREMRVLDLGCGRGITSVFLAREFDVQVWATDLWISATDNFKRFKEAGVDEKVFPVHSEAHELPYADDFFDAAVSIDAYHYFGAEKGYLETHLAKLVKPGGRIGIVVPGLSREVGEGEIPKGLEKFWVEEFKDFHSVEWWKNLWDESPMVNVSHAENMADGKQIWYESIWRQGEYGSDYDREMLEADKDDIFTLIMISGVRI
ncbi:MAG: methyltransferase domain-containing protein [Clostridia bacterium]|nr:methyltransferase domain-containing protein [Clostridia bacterium]